MADNTTTHEAPNEAFSSSDRLISEALGQEVVESFVESSLGVLVESPPTFDPEWLIQALDRATEYRIGLAMVNIDEVDIDAIQAETLGTSIRVGDDLATAIEWRNEAETEFEWDGGHVPDRIVVLVRGDPARLNSLHRLYDLPLGEVRYQITSLMQERPEFGETHSAQKLWEILGKGNTTNLSIKAIAEYSVGTLKSGQQASIEALGDQLHHLGLFPDANLLTGDIADRLDENDESVSRVLHLTNRDRRRLMNSIQSEVSEDAQEEQAEFVELLRRYQRTHDDSLLGELEFDRVRATLETSSQSVSKSATSAGPDGSGGEEGDIDTDSDAGGRGRSYTRRHDDSSVGVELAFADQQEEIEEIAGNLEKDLPKQIDKEENQTEITYSSDSKVVIDINSDVYHFLQRFVDANTFGGIIEDVESRTDALENIGSLATTKFKPRGEETSIEKLRTFADRNDDFEPVVKALENYFEKRANLVDHLPQLVHSPVLALLGDDELFDAATKYLSAYQSAQQQIDTNYRTLQEASTSGAAELLSEFLLFDMIVLEAESGREMILSPLHPLHLWKYVRLAKDVSEGREELTADEKSFLEETVDEQPHVLNNVSIGGGRYLAEELYLIQSDELQRLPIYTEANEAEPGTNKGLWEYLLQKFTSAYPPARPRLKLTVVDPLRPVDLLKAVSDAAQDGILTSADLEFCYVNSEHEDILRGATSAEEEDVLTVFGPRSDFDGFTVQTREERSLDELADSLATRPRHCVVVNDNGTFQVEEFERDPNTSIHPLYVPKEFDYDAFQDEIQIRASTEGELFSEYQDLVNQLFNTRTKLHKSGVHDLKIDHRTTEKLLDTAIWTIISTPTTNVDPFWESNLISKERRGDRNYGIYSQDFELFTRTLNRLLREYPIAPSEIDTNRLARRIAELQNSGLLRLITEETLGEHQSKNTQGLLGAVIALQWLEEEYEGPKLIFSIDDPRTRRWLNFGDANRRADFVVAQLTDTGGIELTIVEVKTPSEPDTVFEVNTSTTPPTAKGDAVDQVTDTRMTIQSLFQGEDNVTKQPRREALREQLYYELVGADIEGSKSEWADAINNVFQGDAGLRTHPAIVSVELNNPSDTVDRYECVTSAENDEKADRPVSIFQIPRRTIVRLVMNGNDVADPEGEEQIAEETKNNTNSKVDKEHATESTQTPDSDNDSASEPAIPDSPQEPTSSETESDTQSSDEQPSAEGADGETEIESFGSRAEYAELTEDLKRVLSEFGIGVRGVPESEIDIGPNVIRYKVELAPGEEQSQLRRRSEDIARELALDYEPNIHRLSGTRFVAVDIPRTDRKTVDFYDYIDQLPNHQESEVGELPYIAGIEPAGTVKIADLQDAPHMLVGGATGSGKTVFLRSLLASILEQQQVDDVEFAIIDPKQTDFVFCNTLPNLKTGEVITSSDAAYDLFDWIVDEEIPRRTEVLKDSASVDIRDHNKRTEEPMKPLVVIVDEYADLLDSLGERGSEFETQVRRIAQRARNVGIHLVIATQRPSAEIIDTDLRSNLGVRVAFRVPSGSDSQVILDETGAEGLAGAGDMLFKEAENTLRLQGTLIELDDIRDLVTEF